MARIAGKLRADLRAMEIQANDPRTNPVSGAGATPSMGLSQFRGGVKPKRRFSDSELQPDTLTLPKTKHLSMGNLHPKKLAKLINKASNQHYLDAMDFRANEPETSPVRGSGEGSDSSSDSSSDEKVEGGAHHRTKNSASRMSDATAMGLHLGQHLHSLHGAGFFDRFRRGFNRVIVKPVKKAVEAVAPFIHKAGEIRQNIIEPIVRPLLHHLPYGEHIKTALDTRDVIRNLSQTFLPEGKLKKTVKAIGLGKKGGAMYPSGQYEGQGRESDDVKMVKGGKKRRAPAKEGDGRRKRAEIVKKVMKEKGMKMIEASKYVKAHNLY